MSGTGEQEVEVAVNPEGRVHVLNQAGIPVTIDEADVGKALASGYQLESRQSVDSRLEKEQFETPLEQAKAAGEGALRGATLGLGTYALSELGGDEYREAALRRQRLFPKTAVAGEVAGALAPSLLTGGSGAAAEAASLTPVSLAARAGNVVEHAAGHLLGAFGEGEGASLAARAAREAIRLGSAGATEGAAYGLGSSLADSALEGTDWTAERALAGLKEGALYGLTGGAGLGAAGEVAGAAGRKVLDSMLGEGKTLRQAVQDFADGRQVKTVIGNDVSTFRKLTENGTKPQRIGEAADWLREHKIPVGGPIEESRDALQAARKLEADNMGAVARELDTSGVRVDPAPILEKLERRLADLDSSGLSGAKALASSVRRQVAPLRQIAEKGEGVEFSQLWRDSSFIRSKVKEAGRKASPAQVQLEGLYDDMRGALREAAGNAAPELASKWANAERNYAVASTLYEGAKTEATRQVKNRFISPSDYGTGLSAALASIVTGGGAPGAILTGIATSAAHKLIRERGSAVVGKLADWAANAELGINRTADRLVGIAENEGALAGELSARVKAATKFTAAKTVDARDVADRAQDREELGRTVLRGAQHAEQHEGNEQERFERARGAVLEAQRNPDAFTAHIQRVIEPIAHEQPEVASAMARKLVQDHQYLVSKLPKPLTQFGRTLGPADKKPLFSKHDQRKFLSAAEALQHPERALRKLGAGKVDFDAIDALKERRPEIWGSLRTRVLLKVSEPGANVSHRRRLFLSMAFDIPADPTMAPGTLAAIGASLAPPPEEQAPPPAGKVKPEEFSKSMATPSQQATV